MTSSLVLPLFIILIFHKLKIAEWNKKIEFRWKNPHVNFTGSRHCGNKFSESAFSNTIPVIIISLYLMYNYQYIERLTVHLKLTFSDQTKSTLIVNEKGTQKRTCIANYTTSQLRWETLLYLLFFGCLYFINRT